VPNPATQSKRPNLPVRLVRWVKERSKAGELASPTVAELAEGVWPRAKRDAKKIGTGTFSGGVTLLLGTGIGVHLAGRDHAPNKPPTALVEIGFPIAGFVLAAAFILLVRLLLTFRAQRNEARSVLGGGHREGPAEQPPAGAHIGEYHAHGPTFVVDGEALPLSREALAQLANLPRLPQATRPEGPQVPQAAGEQADDTSDGGVAQP
jgi:hypothetical protein